MMSDPPDRTILMREEDYNKDSSFESIDEDERNEADKLQLHRFPSALDPEAYSSDFTTGDDQDYYSEDFTNDEKEAVKEVEDGRDVLYFFPLSCRPSNFNVNNETEEEKQAALDVASEEGPVPRSDVSSSSSQASRAGMASQCTSPSPLPPTNQLVSESLHTSALTSLSASTLSSLTEKLSRSKQISQKPAQRGMNEIQLLDKDPILAMLDFSPWLEKLSLPQYRQERETPHDTGCHSASTTPMPPPNQSPFNYLAGKDRVASLSQVKVGHGLMERLRTANLLAEIKRFLLPSPASSHSHRVSHEKCRQREEEGRSYGEKRNEGQEILLRFQRLAVYKLRSRLESSWAQKVSTREAHFRSLYFTTEDAVRPIRAFREKELASKGEEKSKK